MKIELIRDGSVYRVKGGKRSTKLPDRLTVEIHTDSLEEQLKDFDGKKIEIWSPVCPPGAEKAMRDFLERTADNGE